MNQERRSYRHGCPYLRLDAWAQSIYKIQKNLNYRIFLY